MEPKDAAQVREAVSEYYGKELSGTADLKTSACLTGGETTAEVRALLRNVHDEVKARFYGCGSPIPPLLRGLTTLDLGCGCGRDTYVLAQLVGPEGQAVGVDMTREMLAVARSTEAWHTEKFGYGKANTLFLTGDISDLAKAGVKDASVDVVVSNCVLNLAADKLTVFREVFRVLKPGGELYFSDVYADRRIPEALQRDKVLWGECLSGALYRGDFARIMRAAGFAQWWTVTSRPMGIADSAIGAMTKGITFYSETVRAFKVDGLEDAPEDYGQYAVYNGSLPGHPHVFSLGLGASFITDEKTPIDGNTAAVLRGTRYASLFRVSDPKGHRGPFRPGYAVHGVPAPVLEAEEGGDVPISCCAPPSSASASTSSCCTPAAAGGEGASGGKKSCC